VNGALPFFGSNSSSLSGIPRGRAAYQSFFFSEIGEPPLGMESLLAGCSLFFFDVELGEVRPDTFS